MRCGPSSTAWVKVLIWPEAESFELSLCSTLMTTRRVDFGALSC